MMIAGFFFVLILGVVAGSHGSVVGQLPMAIPREALADRANQLLKKLGYGGDIADRATGFQLDNDYLRWTQKNGPPAWRTDRGSRVIPTKQLWRLAGSLPRTSVP